MTWLLGATRADLESDGLVASLDLSNPGLGLGDLHVRVGTQDLVPVAAARLLRFHAPGGCGEVADRYVRGDDLVVSYSGRGEIRSQVYWRMLRSSLAPMEGVELIVSVETSQLDREAICEIASELPAEAVLRPRDAQELVLEEAEVNEPHSRTVASNQPVGLFVYRLAAVPLSYAEMVHPLAAWQVQMARDTSQRELVRSTFRIFPERLEKGVLRRGQFRGYFLPREGDLDAARVLYREFAASDLPLTT